MEIHKVTDREVEICGWAMERETEGCVKLTMQVQLAMLREIRNDILELKKPLLQKIMEKIFGSPKFGLPKISKVKSPKMKSPKTQKVYKTPTGNKEDIIVGVSDTLKDGDPTTGGGAGEGCGSKQCSDCKCADKEPEEPKVREIIEGSESK